MKTLFLNHYLPFPLDNGGAIAHSNTIEALGSESDVHLIVITSSPDPKEKIEAAQDHFEKFCRKFTFHYDPTVRPSYSKLIIAWHYLTGRPHKGSWSAAQVESLRRLIQAEKIDVMWVGSPFTGKYFGATEGTTCKRVLVTQNVESEIIRQGIHQGGVIDRMRRRLMWRDVRKLEEHATAMADAVTAITDHDAAYFRKLKSAKDVFHLPFALPPEKQEPHLEGNTLEQDPDICFIGSMDWAPNEDAACFLIEAIMPLVWRRFPELNASIVGKNPGSRLRALTSDNVIVTGRVPSVQAYLDKAKLIVLPIREGSGIKIKLIEAMAAGKAVVTTAMGAQGTGLKHNYHAVLAETAQEIADAIVALMENQEKRQVMGMAAQQFILNNFSFSNCRQTVRRILEHLESKRMHNN